MESVAQVLAHGLLESGIDTVFGIPGGENVEVVDAVRQAGLRFILVHHEASAVFMADTVARLTGGPSACLTTLGPGATNSVAGVAHAWLDRSPVLVITAQIPDRLLARQPHQFIDIQALFAPITKRSFKLKPGGAAETVRFALELTRRPRPGPVHLQISNEVARSAAHEGDPVQAVAADTNSAGDMIAAHDLIMHSRRPVIVAGLGLEPERPYEALCRLAGAARAPVITTPKAKGSLPDDHPLAAGTIGSTRNDPAYKILDEADCILAVGFDVVELVKPWNQLAPLIWIANWENRDPALASTAEFVGTIGTVLAEMSGFRWTTDPDWGEQRVQQLSRDKASEPLPAPAPGRLLPQSVLRALRQAAPREVIVTTDVGSHKILASLTWPSYRPNSYFVSNGLSSMGFGLPAAIAAGLVDPQRQVICITGDAGLAMALGELGVLARLSAPILVVVLNDSALDLIRSQQRRAGKQPYGTEFSNPDFVRIGEAYGIRASRVDDAAQLPGQIGAALASGKPALLEVLIDPISYPTTPANV